MSTEQVSIDSLIPYARNSRTHSEEQVAQIAASIKEFGFTNPVLIGVDNDIIAGHGRVLAARKLGLDVVPCIRLSHLTETQKRAYVIADNKLALNAGWDFEMLQVEFDALTADGFDMELVGFTDKELAEIERATSPEPVDDEVPELPEEPITKLGDVWILGEHRVMCGDSLDPANIAVLMRGEKAHMCLTDPPYNIDYGNIKHPKFKQRSIKNDSMSSDDFASFCASFADRIVENVLGCVYVWGPPGPEGRIMFSAMDERLHCSTTIVWNKDQFTLGRGKYQSKYEPCWFGWGKEGGARFTSDRTQTNVWDFPRPKASEEHPTMKPVALFSRAIEHASLKTDVVLDLFLGSGTTLIAAEQLGRKCYGMELDPKYVDVIVKRWEILTGQKATKEPNVN